MAQRREQKTTRKKTLPEPSLIHLKRLTDDTGLFQHAKFTIMLRQEGYATDDNARAVIVTTRHYHLYRNPEALRLLDRYLAFLIYAHKNDGTVRNFMLFDRSWKRTEPDNDALGRVLWAYGALLKMPPSAIYVPVVKERFDISAPLIEKQPPRAMAHSMLGLSDYLTRFPQAEDMRQRLRRSADTLVHLYEENNRPDWVWFEEFLTYDNAIFPHALFMAAMTLNEDKYLSIAQKTCEFLLASTYNGNPTTKPGAGHFSFVGCRGWFWQGKKKAQFDQQPVEAAGTAMMLTAAYQATGNKNFLKLRRKAFEWFLGENDLGIPLYDRVTKGCSDGLGEGGVNANQGAESTLSYLLARFALAKSRKRKNRK